MRRHYIDIRQQRIDSLKDSYDKKHRTGQLIAIADAYSSFANDSAITYYERALASGEHAAERTEAALKRAALLPLAGFYESAVKSFDAIDTTGMPERLRPLYYESGRRLYSYLASAYDDYAPYRKACNDKALVFQERLLDLLDRRSDDYLFNLGEYYFTCWLN